MTTIETATMSERGQIIIPKDVRDYIGAGESTIFTVMTLDKETIVMKKLDTAKLLEEFRGLRKSIKEKMTSSEIDEEIAEVRRHRHTSR